MSLLLPVMRHRCQGKVYLPAAIVTRKARLMQKHHGSLPFHCGEELSVARSIQPFYNPGPPRHENCGGVFTLAFIRYGTVTLAWCHWSLREHKGNVAAGYKTRVIPTANE